VEPLSALRYLEQGASLGHIESLVSLGALHYHGMCGLKKDARRAFEIYNEAAEVCMYIYKYF